MMKTELTIEESAKLIERGIPEEKASKAHGMFDSNWKSINHPIFTLADLLGLLPKEIVVDTIMCENYHSPIDIGWEPDSQKWHIGYSLVPRPVDVGVAPELIDALYTTILWAIDNGHISLTK